jgi:hypothetical protein
MKKVKKMRGGGHCDKANTNLLSGSNAITERTFIKDMNDEVKHKRFIELISSGGYNNACLNNFIEIINAETETLTDELNWAKKEKNPDIFKLYSSARIPKITMFEQLKRDINDSIKKSQVSGEQDTAFSFDKVHSTGSDEVSGSNNSTGYHDSRSNGQTRAALITPGQTNLGLLKPKHGKKGGKSRKHKRRGSKQ